MEKRDEIRIEEADLEALYWIQEHDGMIDFGPMVTVGIRCKPNNVCEPFFETATAPTFRQAVARLRKIIAEAGYDS